jgi:hypothetical protein
LPSIPSGGQTGPPTIRNRGVLAASALFAATFLYVLPDAAGLIDDHFMHVAWGRQLLYGRWFVRDMAALGMPLQSAISAASEWVIGYRLLSEGLITALAFATGAAMTCVLARRVSGSTPIGVAAAAFQVAMAPRTYGYPKIVPYAAAILVFWAYIDRPSRPRFAWMAAIVGAGFYLRHDHGLYLGLVAVGTLLLRHADDGRMAARRLAVFAAISVLTIGPYLVYTQVLGAGVVTWISDLRMLAKREHQQNHFEGWPQWPLSSLDDLVRWSDPRPSHGENILTSIAGPSGDDTPGADRSTGLVTRWGSRLSTLDLLPGLDNRDASAALLFYVFLATLPVTLVGLVRARHPDDNRLERAKILVLLLIGAVTAIGFLRTPLAIRIPDAVVVPVVLAAWWVGRWRRGDASKPGPPWRRAVGMLAMAVVAIPIVRSAVVVGEVRPRLERVKRVSTIWRQLWASPPFEQWQQTQSAKYQAVRYVRDCTSPDDTLLVLWFAPDLYYYSGRPFAGRLGFYMEGYWASPAHEQRNLATVERDQPAIVLMEPGRRATDLYTYPRLLEYVAASYYQLGELRANDGSRVRVLARKDRTPSGIDQELGWPCFSDQPRTAGRTAPGRS